MKASKLIVFAGGILGIIAFFLPLVTVDATIDQRVTKISVSAFQVVKGIGEIQAAATSDEAKAHMAGLDEHGKKAVTDVDAELDKIKGIVIAFFFPALMLALIGGLGLLRKQFGRLAGFFSLFFGIAGLGIGALLRGAASENGDSAGIAMTILLLTGAAGFIGGLLAMIKPERRAVVAAIPPARTV